ncbi:hypothetical protein NE865_00220 [Phthorimaea operculella]|nr:hypothetical protein NE865_00220 [Phthorimaea operculella]
MRQGMLEDIHRKASDKYPLLMVAGAGDATVTVSPPVGPNVWTTTMTPRRSWKERWPEYLSSCWLATILLGISFLVFYSIAMAVICRNDSYFLFKLNDTKPANEVFYHHIVPRGGVVPMSKYELYLGDVATTYPSLTFKVFFLIDDTKPRSILEQIYTRNSLPEYNAFSKKDVKVFQETFQNVQITVMPLSRFMAGTPLKYRWRSIPIKYIPFYCRVFAVWLNGGIGIDLVEHNGYYLVGDRTDRKLRTLLKQHNDGITPENYLKNLHKLESEDESEYLASFLYLMQKVFKDTISYLNSITPTSVSVRRIETPPVDTKYSSELDRIHRMNQDMNQDSETIPGNTSKPSEMNIVLNNKTVVNLTADARSFYETVVRANTKSPELFFIDNGFYYLKTPNNESSQVGSPEHGHETGKNKSELPKIVFFYDFLLDEGKSLPSEDYINLKENRGPLKVVTIETEGSFVASTERTHPFLGVILSAGCKRLSPKFAIQNTMMLLCNENHKPKDDDHICKNIHVL